MGESFRANWLCTRHSTLEINGRQSTVHREWGQQSMGCKVSLRSSAAEIFAKLNLFRQRVRGRGRGAEGHLHFISMCIIRLTQIETCSRRLPMRHTERSTRTQTWQAARQTRFGTHHLTFVQENVKFCKATRAIPPPWHLCVLMSGITLQISIRTASSGTLTSCPASRQWPRTSWVRRSTSRLPTR